MVRRTRAEGAKTSVETICGITDLLPEEADEHRLLELNRGHWSIENKRHLPRDTTYREDHSRIRKHHGARSLATLQNLAIGLHALGVLNTRESPCKTILKMNRKTPSPPSNRDRILHNSLEQELTAQNRMILRKSRPFLYCFRRNAEVCLGRASVAAVRNSEYIKCSAPNLWKTGIYTRIEGRLRFGHVDGLDGTDLRTE